MIKKLQRIIIRGLCLCTCTTYIQIRGQDSNTTKQMQKEKEANLIFVPRTSPSQLHEVALHHFDLKTKNPEGKNIRYLQNKKGGCFCNCQGVIEWRRRKQLTGASSRSCSGLMLRSKEEVIQEEEPMEQHRRRRQVSGVLVLAESSQKS